MKQDPKKSDIVQRIQNGETQAFRVIVEMYQHPVFVWVANFLGPDAASDTEDIVQEIFLSVYTHIQSFDKTKANFNTWLFTIARNRCINELRTKRPELKPDVSNLGAKHDTVDILLIREIHHKLDQALSRLSASNRSIFILAEFLGFTYEDISRIEKIRIGTVKSRLARARKQLRMNLNQYWEQYKETE
jgi:RNA polymerase sigma-70 factor (ECF subfamily)